MASARLRIVATKALLAHEPLFEPKIQYPDIERFPDVIKIPRGVLALADAVPMPEWGSRFGVSQFARMANDDGFMLSESTIRPTLELGGKFGDVSEPISHGMSGLAWAMILTARGNLAQTRVQTILHLAYEQDWKDGDTLFLPRRGLFAPYAPDKGAGWDRRLYPEVLATLKALALKEIAHAAQSGS